MLQKKRNVSGVAVKFATEKQMRFRTEPFQAAISRVIVSCGESD